MVMLQIWDIVGRGVMTSSFYRGVKGVFIVFDVTDENSFVNLSSWMQQVTNYYSENVKKIVIGNKIDLVAQRVVTFDQAKEFAEDYGASYIECSAKEGVGVYEGFLILTESIKNQQDILRESSENVLSGSLKINQRPDKDMRRFCLK